MKIILTMHLPYFPILGGANKCSRLLVEALAQTGHDVQVVVPALSASSELSLPQIRDRLTAHQVQLLSTTEADIYTLNGVKVHAVVDNNRLLTYLNKQIQAFTPDWVLVSSEDWSQGLLETALDAAPQCVIYLVYTLLYLPFGPQAFFPSLQRTKLLNRVAKIVTMGQYAQNYIKKWSGFEATIFPWPAYGDGPFPHLGNVDNAFVTLINPSGGKGISIFLRLAEQHPNIQFAAVPTWGTTAEDQTALKQLPNVHILPPNENFDQILAQTRILLMPSLWHEVFPLTIVEAMLHGIPVLASNIGGTPEAKLGTPYILPAQPIQQFTENLDDKLIPKPIIPSQISQDIAKWSKALTDLTSNRNLYEQHSAESRTTALDYVSNLSFTSFERLLHTLKNDTNAMGINADHDPKSAEFAAEAKEAALFAKLAELTPEKRSLLMKWLQEETNHASESPQQLSSIQAVTRGKKLPLSFAQQRLWFLDQFSPGNAANIIRLVCRLTGIMHYWALKKSLNAIIHRHEILRTVYIQEADEPTQVVLTTPSDGIELLQVSMVDLRAEAPLAKTQKAQALILSENDEPFNIAQDLPLRVTLYRLDEAEYILSMVVHHIAADHWSLAILYRELSDLYRAYSTGSAISLLPLPVQYADFAIWERQWFQHERLERHLSYWRQQLANAPAVLELPTDFPRPKQQTFYGERRLFTLSSSVRAELNILAQQEEATLFMVLLAAFKVLLYRYSRQTDIVVGSPIAGRNNVEIEPLIGFFVNTLVLRTDLSEDPKFRTLVKRVRHIALDAYEHQELSFEKLVEALQPKRDLSRPPFFQVTFAFQKAPEQSISLPNVQVSRFQLPLKGEVAQFDLMLAITQRNEVLEAALTYNSDLFKAETITHLITHFQTLLTNIIVNSDSPISQLSLLSQAESEQLLARQPKLTVDYPDVLCVHQLFEAHATRRPDAIAVVFEGQHLTYQNLNIKANQLAHHLQSLGVGPEVIVGLYLDRSLEMIIALLGIVKAGGAYLPLDPAYPKERLAFMLEDALPPVLITQTSLSAQLPDYQADLICLDSDETRLTLAGQPISNPKPELTLNNLAYVIYTSGSTGKPKGMLIEHGNIARLFTSTQPWFIFNEDDVWTLFHSIAFDFSVWEFWGALSYGGRLVVVSYWVSRSPDLFHQLLRQEQVTVLNQTPSAFNPLIQADTQRQRSTSSELALRYIIFGGEALQLQALQPWFEKHGDQSPQLINMYGITETTVHVTYRPITITDLDQPMSVIGQPIPDLGIYLLDQHQALVPLGIPGEIYVGGTGLGRGYLNQPELTDTRFVSNPFGPGKLYRSGDLGRYLLSGDLEYLGRIDNQIQLHGFRIELGEIENALLQSTSVREAVVIRQTDEYDYLIAYVVPADTQQPTSDQLSQGLKKILPAYMIPATFILLDAIPLTQNGKIDLQALPKPDRTRDDLDTAFTAPRTPIEKKLADLWQSSLSIPQIGVHDNFFALGGHSLLATQVISRLRETFQVELQIRHLFETPTISGLAEQIQAIQWAVQNQISSNADVSEDQEIFEL